MSDPRKAAASDELATFLTNDLFEIYLRDEIDADLDSGYVFAAPDPRGLIRIWVGGQDEDGNATDEVLAERWIAVLEDPTVIDFGPSD